jgi:hypothetical protein
MIGDLIYIMKCSLLSILFIGVLQIKVENVTLESRLTTWFYQSSLPKHIQTAAAGGALAIENAYKYSKENLNSLFQSAKSAAASRSER